MRKSSDGKISLETSEFLQPLSARAVLSDKKGSTTFRHKEIEQKKTRPFAIFGNILVNCQPKERKQLLRKDSMMHEDDFMFAVNKFKLRESSCKYFMLTFNQ